MEKQKTGLERITTIRKNGSRRIQHFNHDPSLTDQDSKDECDVNLIIERAMKGHAVTHLRTHTGTYMDLAEVPDFTQSMQIVANAQNAFNQLPSDLREKFHNSPQIMMEYLADKRNDEEAISLGLKENKILTDSEATISLLHQIANPINDDLNDEPDLSKSEPKKK